MKITWLNQPAVSVCLEILRDCSQKLLCKNSTKRKESGNQILFTMLPYTHNLNRLSTVFAKILKDKSGVDKIIVKKQPYELLNTSREFFPSFDASKFHKLVNESS